MSDRILLVLTRDIPGRPINGRERTLAGIRDALSSGAEITYFRLTSVVEQPGIWRLIEIVLTGIAEALLGRATPFQVLLFRDSRKRKQLLKVMDDICPNAIYFDSIRSHDYLLSVREHFPRAHLVCDFDDLMSRRLLFLQRSNQELSMGYLESLFPSWLKALLLNRFARRVISAYERMSLVRAEQQIATAANAVVLVSSTEAKMMRRQLPAPHRDKVRTIPPSLVPLRPFSMPLDIRRFVFIGSDRQTQNRLTIHFLLGLWRKSMPKVELHIFGKMYFRYDEIPNVVFHGLVPTVDEVYEAGSVALCPAFLGGGLKTKVVEALAYGVLPLGNSTSFEGFPAGNNPLALGLDQFERFIEKPELILEEIGTVAEAFAVRCFDYFSAFRISDLWQDVMTQKDL